MATSTDKLAPRIIINEHEKHADAPQRHRPPVTLIFGFAPIGRTCEMVACNSVSEISQEFGFPMSAPEKYFIDSASRLVQEGATVLMTRLPYDNAQSHTVKYVDYTLENAISLRDLVTVPMETRMREKDNNAVTALKELHDIDHRITQVQRITQVSNEIGEYIGAMTNEQLVELDLDPQSNLPENTFRIVDIRGEQYGTGAGGGNIGYCGIFPVITTVPMALYFSNILKNSEELDKCLELIDVDKGVSMANDWYKTADPLDGEFKMFQSEIMAGIRENINFNSKSDTFHHADSFQNKCLRRFPRIKMVENGKLEKRHMDEIGVLVCRLGWDQELQTTTISILESFHGKLGRSVNCVDRLINAESRYIRMYKNIHVPSETDFYVADGQCVTSLGMDGSECVKYINYKTSIIDPITYMLESVYCDTSSLYIDAILDAGISSTAFAAYVARNQQGETYKTNPEIRTRVDWSRNEYSVDNYAEDYAYVWKNITKLFGDFCMNLRGDCVYLADGPRIMNLERNYPISNFTDESNVEMFNKYLPLFNGYTNNYVARYWNWVYMEDMQWENRGFWVPGSVVMGSQLAVNDRVGKIWYAPAGQTRGLVKNAYDVSVKTKQFNSENDLLYSNQWNFFGIYQNEGVVVEGQKTMQTRKTSLDRLNVRRMVCWIKQQLMIIGNRYKYEPNTASMMDGFKHDVMNLLYGIQRTSGISDYKVICDSTNNSIETIDRHELWCKIAIKPIKSIEYIVIDIDVVNGITGADNDKVVKIES